MESHRPISATVIRADEHGGDDRATKISHSRIMCRRKGAENKSERAERLNLTCVCVCALNSWREGGQFMTVETASVLRTI